MSNQDSSNQVQKGSQTQSVEMPPAPWMKVNGVPVGIGGKSYIIVDGKKKDIPEASL